MPINDLNSRKNICIGSKLRNGISIGGGVNQLGTIQVKYSGETLDLTLNKDTTKPGH